MSLLKSPPTTQHLARMYHELAVQGARSMGNKSPWPYHPATKEHLFCLAAEMSRYDPRLLGILVEFVVNQWSTFNPLRVRLAAKEMSFPQTLGVIFDFAHAAVNGREYALFAHYIIAGLKPVSPQLYFFSLSLPAGQIMQKAAQKPVAEFVRWGFLARERPVLHNNTRLSLGHWNPLTRQNIIHELANTKKMFALSEYLAAVDNTISRQQALADLKKSRWVRLQGIKRGSRWQRI